MIEDDEFADWNEDKEAYLKSVLRDDPIILEIVRPGSPIRAMATDWIRGLARQLFTTGELDRVEIEHLRMAVVALSYPNAPPSAYRR